LALESYKSKRYPTLSICTSCLYSRTKGGCKSYVDACHTSDKGKGRGSAALANAHSPAPPRPASSKKAPAGGPAQPQKKHRVSLYYTKPKPGSTSPAAAAAAVPTPEEEEEEHRDLSPAPPLTPEPQVCNHINNNNIIVVDEEEEEEEEDDDNSHLGGQTEKPTHFKEAPPRAVEDKGPAPAAAMFPMETPAPGFPHNMTVGPGPRPGLLLCSPAGQSLATPQRTDTGAYSERRESAGELEVRARPHRPPLCDHVMCYVHHVIPTAYYSDL